MAEYTCLVVVRGPRAGRISSFQEAPGTWGGKEGPPLFDLIDVSCTEEQIRHLIVNARYDFDRDVWVDLATDVEVDFQTDIVPAGEFDLDITRCDALATELNGGVPVEDSCGFLRAKHISETADDRVYWLRAFYPFRKLEGVRDLLKAVKLGLYPDTREALLALPGPVRGHIIAEVAQTDAKHLRWFALGGPPPEVDHAHD